jgi:DNA-binding SARP family transcriptional activator/predicted ATPase
MANLTLQLLGNPEIKLAAQPLNVDTRKAIALLAYLALTGEPHRREKLAAFFWPETYTEKALGALRRTLSVLNKALGGLGLEIGREVVRFVAGPEVWVDVAQFRQLAHAGDVAAHQQAAALYRGDFMEGFSLKDSAAFDDWQFLQSEALRRELAAVLESLVAARVDSALEHARRWLALDSLHEPAHRALMQLYAEAGQHAAALHQYQTCERILRTELGVAPLPETIALFQLLKVSRGAGERVSRNVSEGSATHFPTRSPSHLPLVGRTTELTQLTAHLQPGQLIVIEGEAGIGKTRLLAEALKDCNAVALRCYAGQGALAYGPVVEGLRAALQAPDVATRVAQLPAHHRAEAARLLTELHAPPLPAVAPLESPGAHSRFLEGLRQVLLTVAGEGQLGVLCVDDAQHADAATLDWLMYVVRRLNQPGARLTVLMAWRGEDVPAEHRLRALLAEAMRAGAAHPLKLARLQLADVQELIQALPQPAPASLAHRLFTETEGLPLFITEYLAALPLQANTDWPVPASIRELLAAKLAALSETGQQVLAAAAVLGRSFEFELAQAASGRSEDETLAALDELLGRGLVRGVNSGYDFSHEQLRRMAYEQTSLARRRILHRRAAEALVNGSRQNVALLAGQIATHFQQAGHGERAAQYFQIAGERARHLYANAEALAYFQAALAAAHPQPAALHEAIGDLHTLHGEYSAALQSYAAAAAHTPSGLFELERKLGNVYDRLGEWELAESHFRTAQTTLRGEAAPAAQARLLADWARAAHHAGHAHRAAEYAQRALQLAQATADRHAQALAHNVLGLSASRAERYAEARTHFEASLQLAEARQDPDARVAALNNLALVCRAAGDEARALQLTETALAVCASLGDRHRVAALHNNLADLHHVLGNQSAAMHHLTQAVKLFAEIGDQPNAQPEIWKLVVW